ncbi:MAG: hypothetical protein F6K55_03320 [Moorea sp. SIO4A3]|nr:hypothetical protein [Moorena sp. SIO4A3]
MDKKQFDRAKGICEDYGYQVNRTTIEGKVASGGSYFQLKKGEEVIKKWSIRKTDIKVVIDFLTTQPGEVDLDDGGKEKTTVEPTAWLKLNVDVPIADIAEVTGNDTKWKVAVTSFQSGYASFFRGSKVRFFEL